MYLHPARLLQHYDFIQGDMSLDIKVYLVNPKHFNN